MFKAEDKDKPEILAKLKATIENQFDQFRKLFQGMEEKTKELLLWLLKNGWLFEFYNNPDPRKIAAVKTAFFSTGKNPEEYETVFVKLNETIKEFLQKLALLPADQAANKTPPFAALFTEYAKQWVNLPKFLKVLKLLNANAKVRTLIVHSFKTEEFKVWLESLKTSDAVAKKLYTRLWKFIQIFNYQIAEKHDAFTEEKQAVSKVTREVWLALTQSMERRTARPSRSFLTEEGRLGFKRALFVDLMDEDDTTTLPAFLFANPRITELIFDHSKLLKQAARSWKIDNQQPKQTVVAAVSPSNVENQPVVQAVSPVDARVENKLPAVEEKQKILSCVDSRKLESFIATLKSEQMRCGIQTYPYLNYFGYLADSEHNKIKADDNFGEKFRSLLRNENAEEEFYRAVFGFTAQIYQIPLWNYGLLDVNSKNRFKNDELFRGFVLKFPRVKDFLFENFKLFKDAAENWNHKGFASRAPTLAAIPEEMLGEDPEADYVQVNSEELPAVLPGPTSISQAAQQPQDAYVSLRSMVTGILTSDVAARSDPKINCGL